jgi:hypothetical protein
MELIALFLSTEPDGNAQVTYLYQIIGLGALLVVGSPAPLLDMLLHRMTDCVERWALKKPTLRRYLHALRAQLATCRQAKPWTLVTEAEITLRLAREVGDKFIELGVDSHLVAWGWLDLGDRERIQEHLKALEASMLQNQTSFADGFFRYVWGRALTDSADKRAWSEAERLVAPMLASTHGLVLFQSLANGTLARVALRRGQMDSAEAHARAAMESLPVGPVWFPPIAAVRIHALIGLGRPSDATQVAEQMLSVLSVLGGAGVFEVEFRLAMSEAFRAASDIGRAYAELRETLRQIQLRADDITDPFWKNSYLTRNHYCARAQQLAKQWDIDMTVR